MASPFFSTSSLYFSFMREGLRPLLLPLYFFGWVLLYHRRCAALRLFFSLKARICIPCSTCSYLLKRSRISPVASLQRFIIGTQSRTIVALGNTVSTMVRFVSDKSIVTSFTARRFSSGIFRNTLITSDAFVPRTAATIEPWRQWPSLSERKVNGSFCKDV